MSLNKLLYFIILLAIPFAGSAQDHEWDYQPYPQLDISIEHANGTIQIDEAGVIGGTVSYDFDAVELDIRSVQMNNSDVSFTVSDDQLNILLSERFPSGSEATIEIQYSGESGFGFHQSESQVHWSSALPKVTSHWLPVIDSPRISFTTDFEFHFPAGNQLIFNGRRGSGEIVTIDQESVVYRSESPVSASGLRLITGSFEYTGNTASDLSGSSAFAGSQSPQIYLYSEAGDQLNLLESAAEYFINVQNFLGHEFPYDDLHIVYLEESQWEVRSSGSGVLYLFVDAGDLQHQLMTGIISQWAGEAVQSVNWQRSEPLLMIQAFLLNEIFDAPLSPGHVMEPYDVYSAHTRSEWQHFFREEASDKLKEAFQSVILSLSYDGSEVLDWNLFANMLYESAGTPWFSGFERPELFVPEEETVIQSGSESFIRYNARIEWEEGSERAEIFFNAEEEVISELVTVQVEEITFSGRN